MDTTAEPLPGTSSSSLLSFTGQGEGHSPVDCAEGGGKFRLQLAEKTLDQEVNAGSVRGLEEVKASLTAAQILLTHRRGPSVPSTLSPAKFLMAYFGVQSRREDGGHPEEVVVESDLFGRIFPHRAQDQDVSIAAVQEALWGRRKEKGGGGPVPDQRPERQSC